MFDQRKEFRFITKCDGIIKNCDRLVYYKARWTVITNCDSFFYYKVRQGLLQISTGITKCDDYFKLGQYPSPSKQYPPTLSEAQIEN